MRASVVTAGNGGDDVPLWGSPHAGGTLDRDKIDEKLTDSSDVVEENAHQKDESSGDSSEENPGHGDELVNENAQQGDESADGNSGDADELVGDEKATKKAIDNLDSSSGDSSDENSDNADKLVGDEKEKTEKGIDEKKTGKGINSSGSSADNDSDIEETQQENESSVVIMDDSSSGEDGNKKETEKGDSSSSETKKAIDSSGSSSDDNSDAGETKQENESSDVIMDSSSSDENGDKKETEEGGGDSSSSDHSDIVALTTASPAGAPTPTGGQTSTPTAPPVTSPTAGPTEPPVDSPGCMCWPGVYEVTLDFSISCEDITVSNLDPGIDEVACVPSKETDEDVTDFTPVMVTDIQFLELNKDISTLQQLPVRGDFRSGDTVRYTSVLAVQQSFDELTLPRTFQMILRGFNAIDQPIQVTWIIVFSGPEACGVSEVPFLAEGQKMGWSVFTDLGATPSAACPEAVA